LEGVGQADSGIASLSRVAVGERVRILMTQRDQPTIYRIRVQGHIDAGRAERLGNLSVVHEEGGVTTLIGPVEDQAALYGIIVSLRDMGLELLSVERLGSNNTSEAAEPEED
jgi:hypothetical protein